METGRNRRLLGGIAFLLSVLLCALALWRSNANDTPERFFEENQEALSKAAAQVLSGKTAEGITCPGVSQIDFWDGEYPMVEFQIEQKGLGSSTSYAGVYYSEKDVPLPFQNTDLPLTPSDDGYTWQGEGDNHGYTKQLAPNWYLFEAYF